MCMMWGPQHLEHDHTHFQRFYKLSNGFLEKIFIWPFELIHLGGVLSPILISFEIFEMNAKWNLILAHTYQRVLTTLPHSKESRPEIQKSVGGRRDTRH